MCTHIKSLCSDIGLVSIINLDWVKESRGPSTNGVKTMELLKVCKDLDLEDTKFGVKKWIFTS